MSRFEPPENLDALVGEHTFSGALFSPEKAETVCPVSVLTGEQTYDIPSLFQINAWIDNVNRESLEKAQKKSWKTHTDRVAKIPETTERAVESPGGLISHVAWFHYSITGDEVTDNLTDMPNGRRHSGLKAVSESDEYGVNWTADYENGELNVTVEPTD